MSEDAFLRAAVIAARAAEDIIRHYYQGQYRVELKADHSPVTVADREAERVIKQTLSKAFPTHGFWGEETGSERMDSDYVWLIDPIDGTKSFVRGYPFFSTQIALLHRDQFILGVSNAPIFGELASARRGCGAYLNDTPIQVSNIDRLEDATLSFGNFKTLVQTRADQFAKLVSLCNRTRGYGDFYHSHLLASGKIDMVVESDVGILDVAALSVIIEEAGGQVSELNGSSLSLASNSFVASNGILHQALLQLLQAV